MLAKAHKLDLRPQVSFFRTANRVATEYFTIYSQENSRKLLFQVIVAKGTVKTAVERNALKRSVYDICAEFLPAFSTAKLSIVIVIRRKNIQIWTDLLKKTVQTILTKNS